MTTSIANIGLTIGKVKSSVTSLLGSVSYLKTFIPIAVTNIIYNRVQYEPYLFDQHKLRQVSYKTFSKRIPKNHPLFSVYHWIKDAIGDLDNKYMKELHLILRNKNTKEIIEHYTFLIEYTSLDGKMKQKVLSDEVLEATSLTLENINALKEKTLLIQDNTSFAVQVVLNEDAPDDYITRNFERTTPYVDSAHSECITVGRISTGHHTLEIQGKGILFNREVNDSQQDVGSIDLIPLRGETNTELQLKNAVEKEYSETVQLHQTNVEVVENETNQLASLGYSTLEGVQNSEPENGIIVENSKVPLNIAIQNTFTDFKKPTARRSAKRKNANPTKRGRPKKVDKKIVDTFNYLTGKAEGTGALSVDSTDIGTTSTDMQSRENLEISCMCGINYDINKVQLTVCSMCAKFQHVTCIGYKCSFSVPKPHVCYFCCVKTGLKMTDVRMCNAPTQEMREIMALMRLVTYYCFTTKEDPQTIISLASENTQKKFNEEMVKISMFKKVDNQYIPDMSIIRTVVTTGTLFYKEFNSQDNVELTAISIDD